MVEKKDGKEAAAPKKLSSARKSFLQSEKKRLRNKAFKSRTRTLVRNFEESLKSGSAEEKKARLNDVYSILDKSVKRGLIKKNKASRTKSRLSARIA